MDESVLIPIISAVSALLGAAVNHYLQLRQQRSVEHFQANVEALKYQRSQYEVFRTEALQRLIVAHRLLSKIAREFSLTNLDILWRAEIADKDYDLRYLAICEEMDELRAIVGLYEPQVADEVERIHGNMNIFWGNFKEVLARTAKGVKVDHMTPIYSNAYNASQEIGTQVSQIKRKLSARVSALQANESGLDNER